MYINSFGQTQNMCNTCSSGGRYFSFGKKTDTKFYAIIKGKARRVYLDLSKRKKYYKEGNTKKYRSNRWNNK